MSLIYLMLLTGAILAAGGLATTAGAQDTVYRESEPQWAWTIAGESA